MKKHLMQMLAGALFLFVAQAVMAKPSLVGVLENGRNTRSVALDSAIDKNQKAPLEVSALDSLGNFVFNYRPKAIGYFTLQFENAKSVLCVLKPGSTVFLTIDARTGMLLKTANSDENTLLLNYQQRLIDLDVVKDSIVEKHNLKENPNFQTEMQQLENDRKAYIVELCETNIGNYATAALLEYLDADFYMDLYAKVLTPLRKKYPKDEFLNRKYGQLQTSLRLSPGNPAPDFTLPDTSGKEVRLSDYQGKVVLLDFWASWCPDCRRESPAMVQLYRMYHDKGLEIIGISLDNDRERWLGGMRADGLCWTQLSSLQRWECPVRTAYNVHWIPTLVLIGKDGRIVARGVSVSEVEAAVKAILK